MLFCWCHLGHIVFFQVHIELWQTEFGLNHCNLTLYYHNSWLAVFRLCLTVDQHMTSSLLKQHYTENNLLYWEGALLKSLQWFHTLTFAWWSPHCKGLRLSYSTKIHPSHWCLRVRKSNLLRHVSETSIYYFCARLMDCKAVLITFPCVQKEIS